MQTQTHTHTEAHSQLHQYKCTHTYTHTHTLITNSPVHKQLHSHFLRWWQVELQAQRWLTYAEPGHHHRLDWDSQEMPTTHLASFWSWAQQCRHLQWQAGNLLMQAAGCQQGQEGQGWPLESLLQPLLPQPHWLGWGLLLSCSATPSPVNQH